MFITGSEPAALDVDLYQYGDVNKDNVVNMKDYTSLRKILNGEAAPY